MFYYPISMWPKSWHILLHVGVSLFSVSQFGTHVLLYARETYCYSLEVRLFDIIPWSIQLASVVCHIVLPIMWFGWYALLVMFMHWTASGITYFLIVAPNHDTEGTDKETPKQLGDWGEHQVTHSSNFSNGSRLLTMLFGGMNYQVVAVICGS